MEEISDAGSIQSKPGQSKVILWLAIGTLLLGIAMVVFGITFVSDANASRDWPTATGTVDKVRVTWSTSSSSNETSSDREYYYEVYYDYLVDGQTYSSSRYSLGDGSTASSQTYNTEEEARLAASAAYTPAQAITVYYDSADPTSAVLEPGANTGTYIPFIFGAVLLLAGLGLLWLYRRNAAAVSKT